MSYPRFMVKCVFTFVVFPMVFWVPFSIAPFWEYLIQVRNQANSAAFQSANEAARELSVVDTLRFSMLGWWPALIFWFLAFIIWATLTYLMWFRVPNRPRK